MIDRNGGFSSPISPTGGRCPPYPFAPFPVINRNGGFDVNGILKRFRQSVTHLTELRPSPFALTHYPPPTHPLPTTHSPITL
ncbi:MAG: hypothetical protein AAFV72_14150 [Cyanobacteria bacterium J06635_1]